MSNVLVATLGGLFALCFWGTSDWLTSKSSKKFTNIEVNLALQLVGALMMAVVLLISGEGFPALNQTFVLMLGAAFFTVAYLCFIRGLSIGETGVVVPLANTYPFVTLILTLSLLDVSLNVVQITSMVVIILGAVLLGYEKVSWANARQHLGQEVIYALGASIFWGSGFFTANTVVDELPWQSLLSVLSIAMGFYALLLFVAKNGRKASRLIVSTLENKTGIVAGVALTVGSVAFYISAEVSGSVLIPAVIAAGAPLVASLLAAVFDKERIVLIKRVGALLVVVGVAILNF